MDFRLAPEHPYPAQLDDAETAYRRLLSQGYEPKNIGRTGHSIGGTLAVMLPLCLLAKGEATPGAIVSVSPWTDLTTQLPAVDTNESNDRMLSRATLERFRAAWLQDPAVDFADPQISLVNADLTGLPPTTVHFGEYETLADDGAALGPRPRRLHDHLRGPPAARRTALLHPQRRTRTRDRPGHPADGPVAAPATSVAERSRRGGPKDRRDSGTPRCQ